MPVKSVLGTVGMMGVALHCRRNSGVERCLCERELQPMDTPAQATPTYHFSYYLSCDASLSYFYSYLYLFLFDPFV